VTVTVFVPLVADKDPPVAEIDWVAVPEFELVAGALTGGGTALPPPPQPPKSAVPTRRPSKRLCDKRLLLSY
jgi:hypothetical protein